MARPKNGIEYRKTALNMEQDVYDAAISYAQKKQWSLSLAVNNLLRKALGIKEAKTESEG
ncbi:MAG: hypothetical protein SFU98_21665 [Leptospiraceae bacterium]|nr:hypothetical protein [Leptospiraceae bacterium]